MEEISVLKNKYNLKFVLKFTVAVAVLALGSVILMYVMKSHGYYASGNDIWGHLFKSDLMYHNIMKGNYYPLYTEFWYNGLQPFRYWAPLPYYLMAALQYLSNGDIIAAYYLFAGFSFFIGGLGWLLWGISSKRMTLCTFIGVIWFFMPENFRVFFCEGNLPRMVTTILIPYLVYFIWRFIDRSKNSFLFPIIILMSMMVLSHVMIAAMMGIGTFIFLVFYSIYTRKVLRPIYSLIGMLLSFALCGIWLFPALQGGLVGMDPAASADVMKSLSYSIVQSLNPLIRINGIVDTFYYGMAVVSISVIGILLSNKKEKAGFFTAIIILLTTTTSAVPFLSKLPFNQVLWMMRFATIAYALFFCSLLEWRKCKRYFMLLLMLILLIDCIPSTSIQRYYTQSAAVTNEELAIAKDITKQRVSIIDLSAYGSYPSWKLSEGNSPTKYTYGWAWQGAATSSNIVMINSAMERGYFDYMFDRCVELGNDTVIIRKELVEKANRTYTDLIAAASKSLYTLYQETNQTYIFHREVTESFGTITTYKGLAIGKSAAQIVLLYPEFTGGISNNIDDYTIEDLSKYKVIYLSGFTFNNRIAAENIVRRLGKMDIKVIIDMNRIPSDKTTNRKTFLNVTAQDITFETMYPTLVYSGNNVVPQNFVEEYSKWNTVYLDNIKHELGKFNYEGETLAFLGTNEDENIVFMGCNIVYHAMEAGDKAVTDIISDIFQLDTDALPDRKLVDINIKYKGNKIIIDSPVEGVNTAIAYQDNFESDDSIRNENNLLLVTKAHTEIRLIYPYLKQGLFITILGLVGMILLFIMIMLKKKESTS